MFRILPRRSSSLVILAAFLVIAVGFAGCGNKEMGKALAPPSPTLLLKPSAGLTPTPTPQNTITPTPQPTPKLFILGADYDRNLSLKAGPVELPLEIQIPLIEVNAPIMGVGLIRGNVMDAPKGPADDPIWHAAYWYRGGGIPGEPGTATISGHVTNARGEREIFGRLRELQPGDLIIIHANHSGEDILFYVDQVRNYSEKEAQYLDVLARIFGKGPISGKGPQPADDGLSHLTLITCGGEIVDGRFNAHTVVYATRASETILEKDRLLQSR